jgi:hypothetical protein
MYYVVVALPPSVRDPIVLDDMETAGPGALSLNIDISFTTVQERVRWLAELLQWPCRPKGQGFSPRKAFSLAGIVK